MIMRWTLLNTEMIKALPSQAGVYALKHNMTGRIYFGSTTSLHARILQWFYQIRDPATKTKLPGRVKITLDGGITPEWGTVRGWGHNTYEWFYTVVKLGVPVDYRPNLPEHLRPEFPYVVALWAKDKTKVLNNSPTRTDPRRKLALRSNKGISPLRYLKGRLGMSNYRYYAGQPQHNWTVDKRTLTAGVGPTAVPFALYLLRSMECGQPRHFNPSSEAIRELYRHWRRFVPQHEPAFTHPEPSTINDALAVPVPTGYQV